MENVIQILFCLTLLYTMVTTRVKTYAAILVMQGSLIAVMMAFPFIGALSVHMLIIPLLTLIVKAFLIPRFINKFIVDLDVPRVVESAIQPFNLHLMLVCSMIVLFLSSYELSGVTGVAPIPMAAAFSTIVCGIFLIIFRKTLIIHVVGFLILENGIFLLGTTIAGEMPWIVELGVLLDIFVVVFLMGIAMNRIRTTFEHTEVSALGRLKD
jgi:hydrogenase-4 component E